MPTKTKATKASTLASFPVFLISKSDLSRAVCWANRLLPTGNQASALAKSVLLEWSADSQTLTVTGHDLSLFGRYEVKAEISADIGSIAVPGALFAGIVERLPDEAIAVELSETANTLILVASCGRYSIEGIPPEDYPRFPQVSDEAIALTFPAQDLAAGLGGALPSSATDETKLVLCGVNLDLNAGGKFAATDGHRLSVVEVEGDQQHPDSVNLPRKFAVELSKLAELADAESLICLEIGKGGLYDRSMVQAGAKIGASEVRLSAALLEGLYPDYPKFLAIECPIRVTFDRRDLIGVIERMSVIPLVAGHMAILEFNIPQPPEDQVLIHAKKQDVGTCSEAIAATIETEQGLHIAFDARYLLSALRTLDSKSVVLEMSTPQSPALIKPVGGKHPTTHLIMPIQIRN